VTKENQKSSTPAALIKTHQHLVQRGTKVLSHTGEDHAVKINYVRQTGCTTHLPIYSESENLVVQ